MEPTKLCPRCGEVKDRATAFYTRRNGGTQSWCKDCECKNRKARDRGRASLQVPALLRDQLLDNAATNGVTLAQLLRRSLTQVLTHQCKRRSCLYLAPAPDSLCARCVREADAFYARRRQEVGV